MFKFNLASALFALCLFVYTQAQGWSLFDNVANSGSGSGGSGSGSSRTYHK